MKEERRYEFTKIEKKWQDRWKEQNLFHTEMDPDKPKFYYLDMFPYPSGELHMGHMRNYVIGDVLSRYYHMTGKNVLHPMGFDSFGQPAEAAAIKHGMHPAEWTFKCIDRMHEQFDSLGISFDWDREVVTCVPEYYRWNQWFFLKFLEKGLAYKKEAPVNWCPQCEVVLANEEAEGGKCWRCDGPVTKKDIEQWFFAITKYADRLLEDIDLLEHWPERVRTMQRNWIGKSEGAEVTFKSEQGDDIVIFTTRPDTLWGATFMVLAPEHPLVEKLTTPDKKAEVEAYVQKASGLTEIERTNVEKEKTGVFIGAYAINPVNQARVPIWIADYVLITYGTGAIMAVPGHDERDFEFATRFGLPILEVIVPDGSDINEPRPELVAAYSEYGTMINSAQFTGTPGTEAKKKVTEWLEEQGIGKGAVNYRIRDWLIARQRYWGTPIPVVYCDNCGMVPVPEDQLPVVLPTDIEFTGKGESPLAKAPSFVNTTCPKCGGPAKRETDTMAGWMDSNWYYMRYSDARNNEAPFSEACANYWLPVDQYVGGIEHATLHLLYSRFFTKVVHDLGLVDFKEPFTRLFTQGMIYKDGLKMSKSRGNVVSPDYINERYGADTGRMFILFVGPPEQDAEWSDQGIEGVFRFLNRVWRIVAPNTRYFDPDWAAKIDASGLTDDEKKLRRKTHQTIEAVTGDITGFHFNTAVAALMEMVNEMYDFANSALDNKANESRWTVFSEAIESLVRILSPFAPHISDELWEMLGKSGSVYETEWAAYDPEAAAAEEITVVVQVNGKVRDKLIVPANTGNKELETMALASDKVQQQTDGKQVRKVIVVPGKLVNIVVG